MGQDFVKNSPSSVDSLSNLDLNSSILNLDTRSKVLSSEVGHCLSTSKSTLSASLEGLLMQEPPKMQCINQTFSTSSSSNKDFTSEQKHLIHGKSDTLQRESLRFMKGVMDECTHVANFSGTLILIRILKLLSLDCCFRLVSHLLKNIHLKRSFKIYLIS